MTTLQALRQSPGTDAAPRLDPAIKVHALDPATGVLNGQAVGTYLYLRVSDPAALKSAGAIVANIDEDTRTGLLAASNTQLWAEAADTLATSIADRLGVHVAVSVGGTVRIGFANRQGIWPPDWTTSPADLIDAHVGTAFTMRSAALATASVSTCRWLHGSRRQQRTARHVRANPSATDAPAPRNDPSGASTPQQRPQHPWVAITALAETCTTAEAACSAALIQGGDAADWLTERGMAAVLITTAGTVRTTAAWQSLTGSTGWTETGQSPVTMQA